MQLRRVLVPLTCLGALVSTAVVFEALPERSAASTPVEVVVLERTPEGTPSVEVVEVEDAAAAEELRSSLGSDPDVLAVSADATAQTMEISSSSPVPAVPLSTASSSDPRSGEQWALSRLEAEEAWRYGTGAGVTVAVVDTGVDASHPDLAGRVVPGFDAYDSGSDGRVDPNGHGTHVAGIVAAVQDNSVGISGLAPDVRIMPVRVLDDSGAGDHSDIARGVIWAADNGADIMNLSLGGPEDTQVLRQAVAYARSKGVLVVVAAGNSAFQGNPVIYPAAYDGVLAVAASSPGDTRAIFSSYGSYVDLTAPGLSILSTYPGDQYAYLSGTSMAAPYVAAAAALTRESLRMSASNLAARLVSSTQELGPSGTDPEFGSGMVDPLSARTDGRRRSAPPVEPGMPGLPTPKLPELPNLPSPSMPELPSPTLPTLPDLPSVPGLPAPELPGLPKLPSPEIPGRTGVSLSAAPASVTYGSSTTLTGALALADDAKKGVEVELAARVLGSRSYRVVASSRTDATGLVAFSARPPLATDFVLRVTSGPLEGTVSSPVNVKVSSLATLSFERSRSGLEFSGRVLPTGWVPVVLEQLRKGRWVEVGRVESRPDGRFTLRQPRPRSSEMFRISVPGRQGYAAASSKPVTYLP